MSKLQNNTLKAIFLALVMACNPAWSFESADHCLQRLDNSIADFMSDVHAEGQTLTCSRSKNTFHMELKGMKTCMPLYQTLYIDLIGKGKACRIRTILLAASCGDEYNDLGTGFIRPNKDFSSLSKTVKAMCADGL